MARRPIWVTLAGEAQGLVLNRNAPRSIELLSPKRERFRGFSIQPGARMSKWRKALQADFHSRIVLTRFVVLPILLRLS